MVDSKYLVPQNMNECLELLKKNTGNMKIIAGGTDLLLRMRSGKEKVGTLLDISSLGLSYIHEDGDNIRIGAMTELIKVHEYFLKAQQPLKILSETAHQIGSWQIRNLATIGGNICTGNSCADMAVTLLALDAKLKIDGKYGSRIVPAHEFFLAPRSVNVKKTEILTEIIINRHEGEGYGATYIKIGNRKGPIIAILSIATVLKMNNDSQIEDIKAVAGTLAPVPIRLYNSERIIKGKLLTEDVLSESVAILIDEISPRTSFRSTKEYRKSVAPVIFKRSLQESIRKIKEE